MSVNLISNSNLSCSKVLFTYLVLLALPGVSACRFQSSKVKDVESADGLKGQKSAAEIVIFYANETPPSQKLTEQYGRIGNGIASAVRSVDSKPAKEALQRIANSYQNDLIKFAGQVDKDARGLESQICRPDVGASKTGLFIFTNKLARNGKLRYCLPGASMGKVEEVDFQVEMSQTEAADFRYAEMPLASERAFAAMQVAVKAIVQAKNIGTTDIAYDLIVKSHGGGDYFVAPKLSFRSDLLSNDGLVARYTQIAFTVAIKEMRFVDLKIGDLRLGDLDVNGVRFENIALSVFNQKFGDLKVGDLKVGDLNFGDSANASLANLKIGDLKIGDLKIGDLKVGDLKVGDLKVGDLKVGDLKVGDLKVGDGDLKVGDLKVGDLKSGDLKNDLWTEQGDPIQTLETPGITKAAMARMLKEFDRKFALVFFESCDSDLGEDLIYDLLFGEYDLTGSSNFESLYFSDRKGLQYETVNYGSLIIGEHFSESLKAALDAKKTR